MVAAGFSTTRCVNTDPPWRPLAAKDPTLRGCVSRDTTQCKHRFWRGELLVGCGFLFCVSFVRMASSAVLRHFDLSSSPRPTKRHRRCRNIVVRAGKSMRNNVAKEGAKIIGDANSLLSGLCTQVRKAWLACVAAAASATMFERTCLAISCGSSVCHPSRTHRTVVAALQPRESFRPISYSFQMLPLCPRALFRLLVFHAAGIVGPRLLDFLSPAGFCAASTFLVPHFSSFSPFPS